MKPQITCPELGVFPENFLPSNDAQKDVWMDVCGIGGRAVGGSPGALLAVLFGFSKTVANRANENEQSRKGFENARHVWKRPTVLPSNDLL